ncbi:MAG: hypothetical protein ACOX8E_07170 [Ruminococcus sp.]|jgi:hypothetical protein
MNDQTIELLKECNSGCKMAVNSMDQIRKYITDSRLEDLIDTYRGKFEKTEDESSQMLESCGLHEKEPAPMAAAFSWISTEMKMMLDQDNSQVAKIMMNGCNMGIQSVGKYINQYSQASKESLSLAKRLLKDEEDFMGKLKEFL